MQYEVQQPEGQIATQQPGGQNVVEQPGKQQQQIVAQQAGEQQDSVDKTEVRCVMVESNLNPHAPEFQPACTMFAPGVWIPPKEQQDALGYLEEGEVSKAALEDIEDNEDDMIASPRVLKQYVFRNEALSEENDSSCSSRGSLCEWELDQEAIDRLSGAARGCLLFWLSGENDSSCS